MMRQIITIEHTRQNGSKYYTAFVRFFDPKATIRNWIKDKMDWHNDYAVHRSRKGDCFLFRPVEAQKYFNTEQEAIAGAEEALALYDRELGERVVETKVIYH